MAKKLISKANAAEPPSEQALFNRIVTILEEARTHVARTVNSAMVIAYWLIGREIVQELQAGDARAAYGKSVIKDLSARLQKQYGKGFSEENLRWFRKFYLVYSDRLAIGCPAGTEFNNGQMAYPVGTELEPTRHAEGRSGFHPDLGWSHYRALMRVETEEARLFYEHEAVQGRWSKRQLERQISTLLFERLFKSRDKDGMLQRANEGVRPEQPIDIIKDPYALEFLGLPESHRLVENDLETALTNHMQDFLMELGAGFAFVARQKRLTLDGDHFYTDLVFYHVRLKCYVIIDLKVDKLTHGDLGQMQLYVHYYDREVCTPDDNPTIGLILCTDKNDAVVEYVLDKGKERIFASRYKLELPPKEELRRLLLEWRKEKETNPS
ncbi:MAG TPA: PDDEXK nuclease domain-containing protein [Kiritimatiellia bacterium]|nr:PDDEXK nuclease domain-containing protein [Kiritimatiellia bacterium]